MSGRNEEAEDEEAERAVRRWLREADDLLRRPRVGSAGKKGGASASDKDSVKGPRGPEDKTR